MPQSIPVFADVEKRRPWETCYPPVPKDFVWEDFVNFFPLIFIVVGIAVVFVAVFARKNRTWYDRFMLGYFVVSIIIHFGLEQYFALYNDKILDPNNHAMAARIWRHYGVSDTRWHGQQPGIDRAVYGCQWSLEILAAYLCGPTAILTVVFYIMRSPWRWPLQCVSVTAQAYGLFITWLPAYWEGLRSVPNDNLLFYGYFYAWQMPWCILPLLAILQAGHNIAILMNKAAKYDILQKSK